VAVTLRVFENGVVRKIFWAVGEELIGRWQELYNVELL